MYHQVKRVFPEPDGMSLLFNPTTGDDDVSIKKRDDCRPCAFGCVLC